MNNSPLNLLNSIRQPAPEIGTKEPAKERVYKRPDVRIVIPPDISKTPISDTILLKKQENPRMAYKLTPKPKKGFKLQSVFSYAIIGCSIGALYPFLKTLWPSIKTLLSSLKKK